MKFGILLELSYKFILDTKIYARKDKNTKEGQNNTKEQWQIQDFPKRGVPTPGDENLFFAQIFAKNCMKMKEIGRAGVASLTPQSMKNEGKRTIN